MEDDMLQTYYEALTASGNVDPEAYPFEQLYNDYRTYGFA